MMLIVSLIGIDCTDTNITADTGLLRLISRATSYLMLRYTAGVAYGHAFRWYTHSQTIRGSVANHECGRRHGFGCTDYG